MIEIYLYTKKIYNQTKIRYILKKNFKFHTESLINFS